MRVRGVFGKECALKCDVIAADHGETVEAEDVARFDAPVAVGVEVVRIAVPRLLEAKYIEVVLGQNEMVMTGCEIGNDFLQQAGCRRSFAWSVANRLRP